MDAQKMFKLIYKTLEDNRDDLLFDPSKVDSMRLDFKEAKLFFTYSGGKKFLLKVEEVQNF